MSHGACDLIFARPVLFDFGLISVRANQYVAMMIWPAGIW